MEYGGHGPKRADASPIFKESETLYLACRRVKVLSPFSDTSQTRLEERVIGEREERAGIVQVGSPKI